MPVRVGALRGSSSNGFYQRHGFMRTAEDEWDIYYIRMPHAANVAEPDGSQHLRGR